MTSETDRSSSAASTEARWFWRLDRWAAVSWRFIVVVGAIALAVWLILHLRLILLPTVFAVFMCTALIPVRNRYERLRLPRTASALLSVLTGFIALALLVLLIIPPVISDWSEISNNVERAYDDIIVWLEEGPFGLTAEQGENLRRNVESAQDTALEGAASGAVSGLPVVFEIGGGILLAIIVTFFFLRDGERIWDWAVGLLPESERPRARRAGANVWYKLARYLRGLAIVAAIDAVGIGIGAYIIGVPLALPLAVLTFITAFVPIVGAVFAGLVAILIAFADGGLSDALWMLGVALLVQQLEANVVAPALIGRSVEIHPLVILLGVAAGGGLAGILGAVLVTPFLAIVVTLLHEFLGEQSADADTPMDASAAEAG